MINWLHDRRADSLLIPCSIEQGNLDLPCHILPFHAMKGDRLLGDDRHSPCFCGESLLTGLEQGTRCTQMDIPQIATRDTRADPGISWQILPNCDFAETLNTAYLAPKRPKRRLLTDAVSYTFGSNGAGGIRTPVDQKPNWISNPAHSTALPPLQQNHLSSGL